jgi:hypothetical protein
MPKAQSGINLIVMVLSAEQVQTQEKYNENMLYGEGLLSNA